ncbi:MAG: C4-type zinc ribbon domain-containing protein [Candidatus Hydrogenedentota bacterium]
MRNLLTLQELDQKINTCKRTEIEIPKQKSKYDIQRKRLQKELVEREEALKQLQVEQKGCEGTIEQKSAQIQKYNQQLNAVKKNEEYQALLHEIELEKKGIAAQEERIITILIDLDDGGETLIEDKKRIKSETDELDRECAKIDDELKEAVQARSLLEEQREPLLAQISDDLTRRYNRLCKNYKTGAVVVAVNNEVCSGCHMHIRAQVAIEVMAGNKIHGCQHCGRLLYHPPNFENVEAATSEP